MEEQRQQPAALGESQDSRARPRPEGQITAEHADVVAYFSEPDDGGWKQNNRATADAECGEVERREVMTGVSRRRKRRKEHLVSPLASSRVGHCFFTPFCLLCCVFAGAAARATNSCMAAKAS